MRHEATLVVVRPKTHALALPHRSVYMHDFSISAVRAREVLERKRNEHKPSPLGLVTEVG